ncbi:MAG: MazG nucleotide pyrophosphohydrolase domain-containing protein [Candidatus Hydrogenedens sp.]
MDKNEFLNFDICKEGDIFELLISLARYLRSPEGCPWDRKQTSLDFAKYAKEECEEFIEALEKGSIDEINEEFGDALFILLASAVAGEFEGKMNLLKALQCAHKKMIRRHEHVFGDKKAVTEEEAWNSWHKVKESEKKNKST